MMPDVTTIAAAVLRHLDAAVLVYFLLINASYIALLASASVEMVIHKLRIWGESRWRVLGSAVSPSISILAPAYNEEATIAESVTALLALHYANLEVVVINDGSPDGTLGILQERFGLQLIHPIVWKRLETRPVRGLYRSRSHPNLLVVDKVNGGKADALNVGLNMATGDLVCVVDADTIVDADALQRLARPFLSEGGVLAAGGTIRLVNGSTVEGGRVTEARAPRRFIAGVQVVEYFRAFLFGRLGWNRLGGNVIISGAFGLFRRDVVLDVGGYTHDTVGEDIELVLKLRKWAYERREKHTISFVPDAVAWTEAPETLRVLGRQRDRWHRGLADVVWRHRRLFLNPRYGVLGLVILPYFVVVELLAPVVEIVGWLALGASVSVGLLDVEVTLLFFLVAYGIGLVLGTYALLMEEWSFGRYRHLRDRFVLMGFLLLESFGYRQLTAVWRLRGLWKYLRGATDWGKMERRGFARPAATTPIASPGDASPLAPAHSPIGAPARTAPLIRNAS